MSRKYLDSLSNIERWDVPASDKMMREVYLQQRKSYGFDSRECYRMDLSFISWLYERVSMFRDMTSNRDDLHHVMLQYNGHTVSQIALIDTLLKRCKQCLLDYHGKRMSPNYYTDLDECIRIWSVLLPAMWME